MTRRKLLVLTQPSGKIGINPTTVRAVHAMDESAKKTLLGQNTLGMQTVVLTDSTQHLVSEPASQVLELWDVALETWR